MKPGKRISPVNCVTALLFSVTLVQYLGCNTPTDEQQNEKTNKTENTVVPAAKEPEWAAAAREAAEEFSKKTWLLNMSSDSAVNAEVLIAQPMSRAEVGQRLERYVESFELTSYSTAQDKVNYLLKDGRRLVIVFNYSLPYAIGVLSVQGPE